MLYAYKVASQANVVPGLGQFLALALGIVLVFVLPLTLVLSLAQRAEELVLGHGGLGPVTVLAQQHLIPDDIRGKGR